jgi:hypothetical protein
MMLGMTDRITNRTPVKQLILVKKIKTFMMTTMYLRSLEHLAGHARTTRIAILCSVLKDRMAKCVRSPA